MLVAVALFGSNDSHRATAADPACPPKPAGPPIDGVPQPPGPDALACVPDDIEIQPDPAESRAQPAPPPIEVTVNGFTFTKPPAMLGGPQGASNPYACPEWYFQLGKSWVSFCADTGTIIGSNMEGPEQHAFDGLMEALEARP